MFEQRTFASQKNSVFNSQIDTNRYASVFDSASLEPTLTPSRSAASYQASPLAESFNQVSVMDAGIPTESTANIDFTQAVNPTWNTEVAASWNPTTAWNNSTTWGTNSSDFSGMRPAGLNLKNAWNSVKDKAKKADWEKIGHGALDVVGALPIPVVSTPKKPCRCRSRPI
ncbi:hypothetical protein [Leptolyngbya sp. 7M]|uniref:hypothetical protein n=1 Tax=Leptolyngbya sp. 7M TaxID=2812896 RepID=UPI001B8D44D1|nr:hypothetical protein [Leptolyngbya sp. 7M]QYO65202.1 hypothetical protein JVX88_37960 [Leptolyngbya sp. 7M]